MRFLQRLVAVLIVIGCALVSNTSAQGQGKPGAAATPSKGLIVGRVLDAASDAPIPGVIVSLAGAPLTSSIRVLTDAKGQFLFRNVPKGSFTLRATIGGNPEGSGFTWNSFGPHVGPYLAGGYGQRRPGGLVQPLELTDGEQRADVVITLWKGGSITGMVRDDAGEPLVDVFVAAARRSPDGRLLNGPAVRTDDRGAYYVSSLVPGDYVIVVPQLQASIPAATSDVLAGGPNRPVSSQLANSLAAAFTGGIAVGDVLVGSNVPSGGNALAPVRRGEALYVYQTTFAPSATSISMAEVVRVGAGEAHTRIDVSMRAVRGVSVSGTVTDDRGPVPNFGVRLFTPESDEAGGVAFDAAYTSTDSRGRFIFPLVTPGNYRIVSVRFATTRFGPDVVVPKTPPRAADRFGVSAQQDIAVGDQDVSQIALQLRDGVTVSGRVEFRGSGRRPPADVIRQLLVFVSPFAPLSRSFPFRPLSEGIGAKDSFSIENLPPGRYVISTNDLGAVSLASVSIGGKTVTERSIVLGSDPVSDVRIEMTDRPAELTGSVRSRAGAADANAGVVLFPADRVLWREYRLGGRMFRSARVSKSGAFTIRPVLPDEYLIAAIADDATADFPDSRFLEALAAVATTVRIEAGQSATVTLSTVEAPGRLASARVPAHHPTSPADVSPHGPLVDELTDQVPAQATKVTVSLTGTVTTDETPAQPVRQAIVTATAPEMSGPRQAVTDDEGRFVFVDLAPGRYSLVVEKPAYVKTFYGATRPGATSGAPLAVLAGQPTPHVTIRVSRGAVITGVVRDQFGMPISTAQVTVKQAVVVNGRRQLRDVTDIRVPPSTTDDQGRYRIYGLPPGEYAVFCTLSGISYSGVVETNTADVEAVLRELRAGRPAPPASATPPARVSMSGGYFPGVPDAGSAQILTLAAGEERHGADILIGPLRALNVTGMSVGPGGAPMRYIMVAVVNATTGARVGHAGVVMAGADGRFTLSALPPGRYTLMGRAAEPGAGEGDAMPYFAETEFVLSNADISGVTLRFERGVTVAGRIVPPAGARTGDVANVRLGATPVDSFASLVPTRVVATTRPDGTFVFDGVGPGKWRVTAASLPAGWSLRSATLDGRDTLDVPFEVQLGQPINGLTVTMTDQLTELSGTVLDADGKPTSEYSMLAFPTDQTLWTTAPRRVSSPARLSSDGRYSITGLPPGEYYLAVLSDVRPGQLDDPTFLESLLASAVKVTLAEGERKEQNYQVRKTP